MKPEGPDDGISTEADVPPTSSRVFTDVIPPVIFVLVLTVLAGVLYELNDPLVQYIAGNNLQYNVAGTSAPSQFSAALIYVIPVIVFTFAMAYVVKKRKAWVLPVLLGAAFAISSVLITLLAYWWVGWYVAIAIPFLLGFVFLVSMKSTIPRLWSSVLRLPFQVWLGTGTAMIFVLLFPLVTLLALCGMMAVWDLYAVLRGPLGKMVSEMKEGEKRTIQHRGHAHGPDWRVGDRAWRHRLLFHNHDDRLRVQLARRSSDDSGGCSRGLHHFLHPENPQATGSSRTCPYLCCSDSSSFSAHGSIDSISRRSMGCRTFSGY